MPILARFPTIVALLCLSQAVMAEQGDALSPCPSSPNCVSSMESGDRHVAPLTGKGSVDASLEALTKVLNDLPRVSWEQVAPGRIEATFTSALFRFVDDVTFILNEDGSIDVRSASRVGYYDFGANRRRVETLRDALSQ